MRRFLTLWLLGIACLSVPASLVSNSSTVDSGVPTRDSSVPTRDSSVPTRCESASKFDIVAQPTSEIAPASAVAISSGSSSGSPAPP